MMKKRSHAEQEVEPKDEHAEQEDNRLKGMPLDKKSRDRIFIDDVLSLSATILIAILMLYWAHLASSITGDSFAELNPESYEKILVGILIIGFLAIIVMIYATLDKERIHKTNRLLNQYIENNETDNAYQEVIALLKNEKKDEATGDGELSLEDIKEYDFDKIIIMMMINNVRAIKSFQDESRNDNETTLRLTVRISIIGLIVVILVIGLTAMHVIDAEAAFIPGITAAITEIGSGIALVLHQRTADQTSRYFEALHENERALYATSMMTQIQNRETKDSSLAKVAMNLTNSNGINDAKVDNTRLDNTNSYI